MKEITALIIIKNHFTMFKELLDSSEIGFDYRFVEVAIESDSLDIAFMLKDKFPQSYTNSESLFVNVISTSIVKSNHCWLAKLFLFKQVLNYVSYKK